MENNYCPSCGARVNDSTIFCLNCGEQLVSTKSNKEIFGKKKEEISKNSAKNHSVYLKSDKTKPNYLSFAIIMIFIFAILTNPNEDIHKVIIKGKFDSFIPKNIKATNNQWEQVGQIIGVAIGSSIINMAIENLVSTNNYILFSLTTIKFQGRVKVIGIGLFGNVYLTNNLDEAVDNGLLRNDREDNNHRIDYSD